MAKTVSFEVDDILFDTFLEFAGGDIPTLKDEVSRYFENLLQGRCKGHIDRQIEALVAEAIPDANAIGTLEIKKKAILDASVNITGVS